ncbi:unnamed protein product [Lactuca saligna]|uniref:PPM-type phosphatase domain-containing protein n=1 Tax=Lactuca saligna TaxID=75948 RepID=A0AA36EC42_LACSI|nr:unnamed protein product [Lactuca saligna]
MSGTTAIIVLVINDKLYVANVGDSRALISVKPDHQGSVTQHTHNHPFFVLASDDIFEFLSSQTIVGMLQLVSQAVLLANLITVGPDMSHLQLIINEYSIRLVREEQGKQPWQCR